MSANGLPEAISGVTQQARSWLDHITVTAPTLATGAAFVQAALGVLPQPGGAHPRMGTHNMLLRFGDSCFLEVIAVDPQAAAPSRPRWFALDTLAVDAPPTLATWVARTDAIDATARASTAPLGPPEPMSRGTLNWQITIPEDGTLPESGLAPALIQWDCQTHPAAGMIDQGLELVMLELFHPQAQQMAAMLRSIGAEHRVVARQCVGAEGPHLRAHIRTPAGIRVIG